MNNNVAFVKQGESNDLFRAITDHGQALIWAAGLDKGCFFFNQPWLVFTGRTLEQELGDGWASGVHPDDLQHCLNMYVAAFDRHDKFSMVYRLRRHDGEYRWILDEGVPHYDGRGNFVGYIGHCLDITERKVSEDALRDSELRYRRLADNSPLAIQVFSPDGTPVRVNAAWERLWQTPFSAIKNYNVLKDKQLEELGFLSMLKRVFAGETIEFPEHMYDKARAEDVENTGGQLWLHAFAYPVQGESDELLEVVLVQEDITARKRLEDRVHQLAFHDQLTQLPNRRLFNDRLSQSMATSKRSGCYGAVIFLDLDNFKPINDAYGHEVGDLLLIEVADRLRSCVREVDTVGRFGGDEFVVMLSELNASKDTSTTQARIVAEKICAALSEPYRLTTRHEGKADITIEYHCTASIGITLFIGHEASQNDILSWADSAMYKAKEAGRNQIRFYAPKA